MQKCSGIYRIELGNGWFYIGSAINLAKRKSDHHGELKRKVHYNKLVQNCWNKYGVFKFTILEKCCKDDLLVREQFYLDQHHHNPKNTNIAPVAGNTKGIKFSVEHRAKISAAKKGHIVSAETRAKISASHKLRQPTSAETRAKIAASSKGRVHSAESKQKMRAAWAARKAKVAEAFIAEILN